MANDSFTHNASNTVVSYFSGYVTVTFNSPTGTAFVTDYDLEYYVPIPEKGQYPVTRVDRTDLTANITWYVGTATGSTMQTPTFTSDTVYAAVILLDAKPDYVFGNNFSYIDDTGKSHVQDPGNTTSSRSVTVTYNATDSYTVTILDLAPYLRRSNIGETPMSDFTTTQYAGAVRWKEASTLIGLKVRIWRKTREGKFLTAKANRVCISRKRKEESVLEVSFVRLGAPSWLNCFLVV
ncbi:MAG: hypothetical protein LBO80_03275 [Treponema sp.]|nr:hypothetical protein [Treponema sp.]